MTTFTVKLETRPGRWRTFLSTLSRAKAEREVRRLKGIGMTAKVVKCKRQAVAA